jgi:hypothetical protein
MVLQNPKFGLEKQGLLMASICFQLLASIIYYVNNVGVALILLCFAKQWPPQHKKK